MSQENLDALHRLYRSWAAGDLGAHASIFDPYVVAVFPDPTPVPQYGLEAIGGYMRRFVESWDDLRFEATDYREAGDTIVVKVRRSATGKSSGVPMEDHVFHVFTFRGELVVRMELFEREADALRAAGLQE